MSKIIQHKAKGRCRNVQKQISFTQKFVSIKYSKKTPQTEILITRKQMFKENINFGFTLIYHFSYCLNILFSNFNLINTGKKVGQKWGMCG